MHHWPYNMKKESPKNLKNQRQNQHQRQGQHQQHGEDVEVVKAKHFTYPKRKDQRR